MASPFSGREGRLAAMFAAQQLQQGQKDAYSAIDTGLGAATPLYQQATSLYGNLAGEGLPGLHAYQDAVGANGAGGYDRATANFRTNPGYQFALNQGLDALDRRAASRGMLGGGGAALDTLRYAQGMGDQAYQQYVGNLAPLGNLYSQGVGGQAGTLQGLGGLNFGAGTAKAGIASNTAQGIANAGTQGLLAGQQAAANQFGALMGGLNLGSQALGSIFGAPMPLNMTKNTAGQVTNITGGGSFGGSLLGKLFG